MGSASRIRCHSPSGPSGHGVRDDRPVARAVARAKEGDRAAVGFLYESYAGVVHAYVRRIVRDEHAAEDVTQSVFAKLFDVIGKYEPREVPFSAWLLRVARNVALDDLRSPRAMPMAQVHEDARFDDADRERRRSVVDALSALPPEQRRVLVMRHFLGLGPREIATRLGKSEGSIHGLHHRGRTALRLALLELDSAPTTGRTLRATAAGVSA